jgi:DNA-binding NarL/FixJ family response regulator
MPSDKQSESCVLIADHHQDVHNGLVLLLIQNGYTVCDEALTSEGSTPPLSGSDASIAIVDIPLDDLARPSLLDELRRLRIPVLVYSMNEAPETIQRAFNAGVSGYVSKRDVPDALLMGLREVLARRRFLSPRAAQSLASKALSLHDSQT